jgi:hypothetical protein
MFEDYLNGYWGKLHNGFALSMYICVWDYLEIELYDYNIYRETRGTPGVRAESCVLADSVRKGRS